MKKTAAILVSTVLLLGSAAALPVGSVYAMEQPQPDAQQESRVLPEEPAPAPEAPPSSSAAGAEVSAPPSASPAASASAAPSSAGQPVTDESAPPAPVPGESGSGLPGASPVPAPAEAAAQEEAAVAARRETAARQESFPQAVAAAAGVVAEPQETPENAGIISLKDGETLRLLDDFKYEIRTSDNSLRTGGSYGTLTRVTSYGSDQVSMTVSVETPNAYLQSLYSSVNLRIVGGGTLHITETDPARVPLAVPFFTASSNVNYLGKGEITIQDGTKVYAAVYGDTVSRESGAVRGRTLTLSGAGTLLESVVTGARKYSLHFGDNITVENGAALVAKGDCTGIYVSNGYNGEPELLVTGADSTVRAVSTGVQTYESNNAAAKKQVGLQFVYRILVEQGGSLYGEGYACGILNTSWNVQSWLKAQSGGKVEGVSNADAVAQGQDPLPTEATQTCGISVSRLEASGTGTTVTGTGKGANNIGLRVHMPTTALTPEEKINFIVTGQAVVTGEGTLLGVENNYFYSLVDTGGQVVGRSVRVGCYGGVFTVKNGGLYEGHGAEAGLQGLYGTVSADGTVRGVSGQEGGSGIKLGYSHDKPITVDGGLLEGVAPYYATVSTPTASYSYGAIVTGSVMAMPNIQTRNSGRIVERYSKKITIGGAYEEPFPSIQTIRDKAAYTYTITPEGPGMLRTSPDGKKVRAMKSADEVLFTARRTGPQAGENVDVDATSSHLVLIPARLAANQYTAHFDLNGPALTPQPADQVMEYEGVVTRPGDPQRTGYTFQYWQAPDGTRWDFATGRMPDSDLTLLAVWRINTYNLVFDTRGLATPPATQRVDYNALAALPAAAEAPGYSFLGWYRLPEGAGGTWDFATSRMPAGDVTLYALYVPNIYVVTFDYNGGGATGYQNVAFGAKVVEVEKPTRTHYDFLGWFGEDGQLWDFAANTMPARDITLTAQWNELPYTATYIAGKAEVASRKVFAGASVPEVAAPALGGYTFSHWEVAGKAWNFAKNKMPAANITLYAKYTENPADVSSVPVSAPSSAPAPESGGGTTPAASTPASATPPRTPAGAADTEEPDDTAAPPDGVAPPAPAGPAAPDGGTPPAPAAPDDGPDAGLPGEEIQDAPPPAGECGSIIDNLLGDRSPLAGLLLDWSLLSLLLTLFGLGVGVLALLVLWRRRREEKNTKLSLGLGFASGLVGLLSLLVFLLITNFRNPMVWINKTTLIFAIVLLVELALYAFMLYFKNQRQNKEDGDDEIPTPATV